MYYFAYGSNMSSAQMKNRETDASFVCTGFIKGYSLRFHKRSDDKSGKADAWRTGNDADVVWGVVYEVSEAGIGSLDKCEGVQGGHYERVEIKVTVPDGAQHGLGSEIDAMIYLALPAMIDSGLLPSAEYRDVVLQGAREHNLPPEYIQSIAAIDVKN